MLPLSVGNMRIESIYGKQVSFGSQVVSPQSDDGDRTIAECLPPQL